MINMIQRTIITYPAVVEITKGLIMRNAGEQKDISLSVSSGRITLFPPFSPRCRGIIVEVKTMLPSTKRN